MEMSQIWKMLRIRKKKKKKKEFNTRPCFEQEVGLDIT